MEAMVVRLLAYCVLFSSAAFAGIIEDVQGSLSQNNLSQADSALRTYHAQHGATPEYLEALSWMARGALAVQQYDSAQNYAKQTEAHAVEHLKLRTLDAEAHLPIALGAALEVEAQVLAARGQRNQAVALLQSAIRRYYRTSIRTRLQKNLNMLSVVGQTAPLLKVDQYLGPPPVPLSQLKGFPVLLFFWAHWCGDCKFEAPIITRLRAEYSPKGLVVIGPTQLYGYAAQGEEASPQTELTYIDAVRHRYYTGLLDMPVPVSKDNFSTYGASTTPTLVLVDRKGRVALYHPGALGYEDLRAAIEKVLGS